jgi:hypothetical protein
MTRVLKRPMFRLGGNTDQGIMSGVVPRQGYSNGELVKKAQEDAALMRKLVGQAPMGYTPAQGLIDWGLNVASATPSGSILNVAAESAKEPVAKYQTAKAQRSAFDQQIGLSAAQSAIAHRDKMKELALKGKTTGLLDAEKEARIMWNNRRTDENPNGSFNTDTGENWTSYEEVLNWVVTTGQFSKSGLYNPKVERNIEIQNRTDFIVEDDDVSPDYAGGISEAIQDGIEGKFDNPNADPKDEISGRIDRNQYYMEEDDVTKGSGDTYEITTSTIGGEYEQNKVYYNPQDGNWYVFDGDKTFQLVIPYQQEG